MAITRIRALTHDDEPAVMQIQAQCYDVHLQEPWGAFESKLRAAGGAGWLAQADGQPAGYLFTLPLGNGESLVLPTLGQTEWAAPSTPARWLYVHDLSICPGARKLGLGRQLIEQAMRFALENGLMQLCLVAVQGSADFWRRAGFTADLCPSPAIQAKLDTFEPGATFMTFALPSSK